MFQASYITWRFDPLTEVMRSVLDPGHLELVQDLALRQSLAGWLGRVEEVTMTSFEANANRTGLVPDLLSVIERRGSAVRRREVLNLHVRLVAFPPGQQAQLILVNCQDKHDTRQHVS